MCRIAKDPKYDYYLNACAKTTRPPQARGPSSGIIPPLPTPGPSPPLMTPSSFTPPLNNITNTQGVNSVEPHPKPYLPRDSFPRSHVLSPGECIRKRCKKRRRVSTGVQRLESATPTSSGASPWVVVQHSPRKVASRPLSAAERIKAHRDGVDAGDGFGWNDVCCEV